MYCIYTESFFSAHIIAKICKNCAKVSHMLRRLLVQFVGLVICFFVCLKSLCQTTLLPGQLVSDSPEIKRSNILGTSAAF